MNTTARREKYLAHRRRGLNITDAAAAAGIARSTVGAWRKKDRQFRKLDNRVAKEGPRELPDAQPVGVEEFVLSDRYLGKSRTVRSVVLKAATEFVNGSYHTCLATGGIGTGKSTLLQLLLAYSIYELSTLPDPHEVFSLDQDSAITLAVQSRTGATALEADFNVIRNMLLRSPYFRACFPPVRKPTRDRIHFPNNIVLMSTSGDARSILGLNAFAVLLDEVNEMDTIERSTKAADGGSFDQAAEMFRVAVSRARSRFYCSGKMHARILVAGSARFHGQFSDTIEAEARSDFGIFVWRKSIWESKPDSFSDQTFRVFTGDAARNPYILREEERVDPGDRHLVVSAPVDLLPNARRDLLRFLQDDAGIPTRPAAAFLPNREELTAAFTRDNLFERGSVFSGEPVTIVRNRIINPDAARHIHLDLSKTRDATGLAIGHVARFTDHRRGSRSELLPHFVIDGVLQIKPPRGGEIDYRQIRELIYTLRDLVNVVAVRADQALSADLLQQLSRQGFRVGLVSVDRTLEPYQAFKDALSDGRIELPRHKVLNREARDVQINYKKGKVDHPVNGSKDVVDAAAGVVFALSKDPQIQVEHSAMHRLMPRLGSHITPIYTDGGPFGELDRLSASRDPFL